MAAGMRVLTGAVTFAAAVWFQRNPGGSLLAAASAVASACLRGLAAVGSALLAPPAGAGGGGPASPIAGSAALAVDALLGPRGSFARENQLVVGSCFAIALVSCLSIVERGGRTMLGAAGAEKMRRSLVSVAPYAAEATCYALGCALLYDGLVCRERRALLATWAFGVVASIVLAVPSMFGRGWVSLQTLGQSLTVANGASACLSMVLIWSCLKATADSVSDAAAGAQVAAGLAGLSSLLVLRGCEMLVGVEIMWQVAEFGATRVISPAVTAVDAAALRAGGALVVMLTVAKDRCVLPLFFQAIRMCKIAGKATKVVGAKMWQALCHIVDKAVLPMLRALHATLVFVSVQTRHCILVPLRDYVLYPLRDGLVLVARITSEGVCWTGTISSSAHVCSHACAYM